MAERSASRLQARKEARDRGEVVGMPWGIDDIDNDPGLPTIRRKKLYLVAARPAMGKTSLMLEVVRKQLEAGSPVGVQSLEMEEDSLADKLIGLQADYSTAKLRDGCIDDSDWSDIFAACDAMSQWPIYLDTVPDRTITQVRSRFRQLAARLAHQGTPLGLIVVDYAQLLRADGGNMEERLAEISRGLLAMAKELNVPVIALAQLNRACEQRVNKRPIMSDLRGSGQFEQDANAILFIYRHEVYHGDDDPGCRGHGRGHQGEGPRRGDRHHPHPLGWARAAVRRRRRQQRPPPQPAPAEVGLTEHPVTPPTIHEDLDLLLVDLDGTIRTCTVPGQPCPNGPGEQVLIPEAVTALVDAWGCGVPIVGITNQGGIGLGFMSEADFRETIQELNRMLFEEGNGLAIDKIKVCAHRPDAGCPCRKPSRVMLDGAIHEANADPRHVLFVGDRDSDRLAAKAAGVRFMWAADWHALFAETTATSTAA